MVTLSISLTVSGTLDRLLEFFFWDIGYAERCLAL